ncbi:MAG: amino acid adenylation domain-containing protein [Verrucomicrobiota bacterium]
MNKQATLHIQVTASFTAEPIEPILDAWMSTLGIDAHIAFSPYNQILQEALDPNSASSHNDKGINLFLVQSSRQFLDKEAAEIEKALKSLSERAAASTIVIFCPHDIDSSTPSTEERRLIVKLNSNSRIHTISGDELSNLYPVPNPFDTAAKTTGDIPYTEEAYAAIATVAARKISSITRRPHKVIVLDADNTLWKGVIGEDGIDGIDVNAPYRHLQKFMLQKHIEGCLLCLASKNNEREVIDVFTRHPGMILKEDHIAASKINWERKSENIREIARELHLGLDSFIFIDDNPAECEEVAANCPSVLSLNLPADPKDIPAFLDHVWALDAPPHQTSQEDALRNEFYRQESQRNDLRESASSLAEFLAGLNLNTTISPSTEENHARVSQLSYRTNQFNANPTPRTQAELESILDTQQCLVVRAADRFGDYGLVGAMIYDVSDAILHVDTFLLSCRALGKGVERAMLIKLGDIATSHDAKQIAIHFTKTDRNEPCERFLTSVATKTESTFSISSQDAAALPPLPTAEESTQPSVPSQSEAAVAKPAFSNELAQRIASDLRSPKTIQSEFSTPTRPRPEISTQFVKPGTDTERAIAAIWQDILGIESVGIEDPFTALGGTSIQLVRVHSRLQQSFDVPNLCLTDLFERPTIATLTPLIENPASSQIIKNTEPGQGSTTTSSDNESDAIAVVGMALRVPGADNTEDFWHNLATGTDSISHFERHEIENGEHFDRPDFVAAKGILNDIESFDAGFFGILPKDARLMDPQQRIFLELAWEAMERAGYDTERYTGRVGVYAGAYFDSYLLNNLCTDREFLADLLPSIQVGSLQTELGNDKDYLATRVAFKMNLRGPSMTLQTACSTSMVAIVQACTAIRSGQCDMAMAGGITITLPAKRGYFYTEQGMLSKDGKCCAFDANASGTVFGNGAGIVVLKKLSDAIRDKDHIHSVIRGAGINNDGGVKHSYTAPSVDGQVEVIRMAQNDAGIDPETISYIEAHGTGTPLGDPIEVKALTEAFGIGTDEKQYCALGSLKTNVGHLDVASGVCGLIKTSLSMENRQLPPVVNYRSPNPKIDFENSPFYVNDKLSDWAPANDTPRRAGISAFGVGGTNAHIVVEEAPEVSSTPSMRPAQLFLLSARSDDTLDHATQNLAAYVGNESPNSDPADAAYTLSTGRKAFRHRRAIVAADLAELAGNIKANRSTHSALADRSNPGVTFMFPGQGSQHLNMAREFYESEPRFRNLIDHCTDILEPHIDCRLTEVLFPAPEADQDAAADRLKNTVLAQPAIFVIEYALADLWKSWGVEPAAMIGHSVGEFVAACHAGVFSLEDGLKLLAERGRLMGDLPGGAMLSVRLSEEELLKRLPDTLDLATINGPELCVVAGPQEAAETFRKELEADDIVAKQLHTSHAFHSRMMDPVIEPFAKCLERIALNAPNTPILSTVTGEWLTETETTNPQYWAKHLRKPVRFHQSVATIADEPEQIFLEIGPGQTLTSLARQTVDRSAKHLIIATCQHINESGSDYANTLLSVGKLWTAGVTIDWSEFYGNEDRKRLVLPTYPFERKRHWVDPTPLRTNESIAVPPLEQQPTHQLIAESSETLTPPAETMTASTAPSRTETLAEKVRAVLADLSGIPEGDMTGSATLLELGFDSLLLTQVSKALQDEFQTPVTMRQLMDDLATVNAIVTHLHDTLAPELYQAEAAPVPQETTPAQAPVASPTPLPAAPAPASATTLPAVAPAQNGGYVQNVIDQQLQIMRDQLAVLGNGAPVPAATAVPVPAPTPAPAPAPQAAPIAKTKPTKEEEPTKSSAPTTAINRNTDESLTDQQQQHLDYLIARYTAKTPTSKERTTEYREWYADPRTVSGFNRNWKEMIYQIAVEKSKGSRLVDIDGNEYIDLLNGFGPNFLGHSQDFVTKALHEQLERGVEVGPQSVTAMEAAKLFCEITGNERASFVNTGSEAVQAAMRLSRTVTGRDKIVVFTKDYHGNFDEVLVRGIGSGKDARSLPIAPGIPRRAVDDVIVLPYGTDESLEVIRERAHELAAVIVEPIQSRRPEFQPLEFIQELRKITADSGTVFVFDEVITGFRTGPRGAQEFYGVEADIATYGKVIGGGMPIGVVAGKAEFMDTFDGGAWQYGDDSFPEKGVTFFAGTFVRHPLAMAALKATLLYLKDQEPAFWEGVKAKANRLVSTVDKFFVENNVPIRMVNFGSQMFIRVDEDHKYANLFFFHLREKGVFLLEGFPSYMTAAHTDEDIDYVIAAFKEAVAELQNGDFFPKGPATDRLNGGRLIGPDRLLSEPKESDSTSTEAVPFTPAPEAQARTYPMTEPLSEVWLASSFNKESSLCFNELNTLKLQGALDIEAIRKSLQEIVQRHDALRMRFSESGDFFTVEPTLELEVPLTNLSSNETTDREVLVNDILRREATTTFNLTDGPLFKAEIIKLEDEEHLLVLNAHHIVCDGWSYNVISSDLSELYAAHSKGTPIKLAPAIQFGEYATTIHEEERSSESSESEDYWLKQFKTPVPPLDLPTDRARQTEHSFRCATVSDRLDKETLVELKRLAGKNGSTLFALIMSAYNVLLHRLTGQTRMVVGFPAAGQNTEGKESLVGHCVNFLPYVGEIDPDASFSGLLKQTRQGVLDALDHQDCTYGRLIKKLNLPRTGGQRPLIDVIFNLERMDAYDEFAGLQSEFQEHSRIYATNTLFLKGLEDDQGLDLKFEFNTALLDEETVQLWLGNLRDILTSFLDDPGASISSIVHADNDRQQHLLDTWNNTATPYPRNQSVAQLFDVTATEHADKIALISNGKSFTYADLKNLSDSFARKLILDGVEPGSTVGILLERSPELIAAMFAILKTGAAYVPLDPEYPEDRLEFMINDSRTGIVLTSEKLRNRLPDHITTLTTKSALGDTAANEVHLDFQADAGDPAYIIYTSGSTGTPKGAVVPHRAITRLVRNTNYCDLSPDHVFLQASTVCFDASVFEIYGALLNGATLAIAPAGPLTLETIATTITNQNVTTLWLTSGLFQLMVDENIDALRGVKQLLTGGDIVSSAHASRILAEIPDCTLINAYGPTENTTFTTCHTITPEDVTGGGIPIGRPIANTHTYILDENRRPAPIGVPGELYTGGDGLALRYQSNARLTEEKFVPNPFDPSNQSRLYRTGDRCRFRADGTIEFLGRIDHQVKIRGFRVEPGEIESKLSEHPAVRQCKVLAVGDDAGSKRLVAYASPASGLTLDEQIAKVWLRATLPDFMIPSTFVVMAELPVNANGKIDTHALPEPVQNDVSGKSHTAPETGTEQTLAPIWQELLEQSSIGIDDDFFALGGHSLVGMRLFARLQKQFDVSLPLATLFQAPTIRLLAQAIDKEVQASATAATTQAITVATVQPAGSESPLVGIHGGDGGIFFYRNLADRMPQDRPFFAFEDPALIPSEPIPNESIEETAAKYLPRLKEIQGKGPYMLTGYSFGGIVAFEMAQQLVAAGEKVSFLGLIDTENPASEVRRYALLERLAVNWQQQETNTGVFGKIGNLGKRVGTGLVTRIRTEAAAAAARTLTPSKTTNRLRQIQLREAHGKAMENYTPKPYPGKITLFKARDNAENDKFELAEDYGWGRVARKGLEIVDIPGAHLTIFDEENIEAVAEAIHESVPACNTPSATPVANH